MSPGEPAVSVEGLAKSFPTWRAIGHSTLKSRLVGLVRGAGRDGPPRHEVFRDCSFSVSVGETVGILGRNGAGKTTLLRTLSGVYLPDAGRIRIRGRLATLLALGAGFHGEFTGRENARIHGLILGMTGAEIDARLPAIEEFSGLEGFLDAPLRTYSSGMAMRLSFSVVAHADPDVLLLDEALSVGDAAFQEKCRLALEARTRSGNRTTILATHDLDAVRALCGRVLVLDPPRLRAYDDSASAVADYRSILRAGDPVRGHSA